MKALSFAAAFVLLSAAPVFCPEAAVCAAEEETEAAVPDWIPADFDSAAAFWKQNGSLTIEGDLLCFTAKEYVGDSRYDFRYNTDYFEPVLSERYVAETGVSMRVELLRAIAPGGTVIFHTDRLSVDNSRIYALEIDEELQITENKLPKWFPKDFSTARQFYNQFGKTRIADGVLCTVFYEPFPMESSRRVEDEYMLAYTDFTLRDSCSVRYERDGEYLLVTLFEPECPGEARICHGKRDQDETPYEYIFRIDGDLNITETDLCGYVPDSSDGFRSRKEASGSVYTKDGDIIFLLETTDGTGYSWKEAALDPAYVEYVGSIDCTELKYYPDGVIPTGGSRLEARVYRAKQDGQTELRLDLMLPGDGAEAEDSLGGVMQITDQAGMVLLPGEARITVLNADTGKPLVYPFDQEKSLSIYYLIGEENLHPENPEDWNSSDYLYIDSAVTKLPLGSLFQNEDYSLWMSKSVPQGYSCDAVYKNGACDAGDAITVSRFTDDIADITVKLQFSAEGDMNGDGAFGIADVVTLGRWLTGSLEAAPANWKAGDFVNDDRLDARDLTEMKRKLLRRSAEAAENGLLLKVHTTYGGYGVMGQDLGSGEFDTEFVVIGGDVFYEVSGGKWLQNIRKSNMLLMKVEKIDADTVTVSGVTDRDGNDTAKTLAIGESYDDVVYSRNIVFDGINYYYEISFVRIPPEAEP